MSVEYDNYLNEHIMNVNRAYDWLRTNLRGMASPNGDFTSLLYLGHHDESKYSIEEYDAYDTYFYGPMSKDVKENFNYAWLHHIHENPHHWQYWVLINDDPKEGEIIMDMPYNYIIEMICDWWAFSWNKGNLNEIFYWYEEHKDYMKLSDNTRKTVEDILSKIKEKLEVIEND